MGLDITESAMCKFLKTAGFTHQKLATFALQRDDALREQYRADVSLYQQENLTVPGRNGC